jgi:hypothetical protein
MENLAYLIMQPHESKNNLAVPIALQNGGSESASRLWAPPWPSEPSRHAWLRPTVTPPFDISQTLVHWNGDNWPPPKSSKNGQEEVTDGRTRRMHQRDCEVQFA